MTSTTALFNALLETLAESEPDVLTGRDADSVARSIACLCDMIGCMLAQLRWNSTKEYDEALEALMDRVKKTSRSVVALRGGETVQ